MGPRPPGGGNLDCRAGIRFPQAASMEPRPRGRGNTVIYDGTAWQVMLQWGRGQVAAETDTTAAGIWVDGTLQWGRPGVPGRKSSSIRPLQWGRGHLAAETSECKTTAGRRQAASMGPRLRGRANHGQGRRRPGRHPASIGPRRQERGNMAALYKHGLQWGRPGVPGRKSSRLFKGAPAGAPASTGPRPCGPGNGGYPL